MGIVIEKASCEDADVMLKYLKQAGSETDNLTFGTEGLSFAIEEKTAHIKQLENSSDDVIFVAKDKGRIIGDVSLNRLPRRMKHRGDLGIAVLREYWNQGISSRLLHEVINFTKENSFEVIECE